MEELIAKRYVKALTAVSTKEELTNYGQLLTELSEALETPEIKAVILSPEVKDEQKCRLILSAIETADEKFKNLIRLLAEKKRLNLIPVLAEELEKQLSFLENRFEGVVYSAVELEEKEIKEIEKALQKRVGAEIKLHEEVGKFDGIKVEVESLGLEISFSKSRIKNMMIEHILKAI
ncbi:F0F1 ATP synthase subunit delta [Nitrosophilus alvini]|uniref:F0F1 ATP synthase subunit delta n=1 Tax=Nitrosophilus alvini TaxID=2714855 RepID=UPI00190DD47D|nr:F0F1 ATP synthase subunit delta [Nitrosophilus alvini]